MSTIQRLAVAGVALVATLAPAVGTAVPAAGATGAPTARSLVRAMAADGVALTQRRAEGPGSVVADGLCSHLAEGGCLDAVLTKDASLLVFDTAQNAAYFTGCGDDRAVRLGRTVVSFGSPPRMGQARQERYVTAVRRYRAHHPRARTDLDRIAQVLMRRGLPMRDAHADEGESRPGLATGVPGAVDMMATAQVDVIVFGTAAAAREYAGGADDKAYRRGRVVLSFGNPALLGGARQAVYARALRHALHSAGPSTSAAGRNLAGRVAPSVVTTCGG